MKFSNKIILSVIFILVVGCSSETFKKAAVMVGEATGNDSLVKAAADMTPQQEYYLGRSIAARVVTTKPVIDKKYLQAYVNYIGQYLAYHSDRPDLFVGYRFAVIEDTTVSAMSAPGGFVIISKGMLKLIKNEDELAAVLAHEIGHISLRHAEKNIKNSNQIALGKNILENIAQNPKNKDLQAFSSAIASGLDISYNKDQEMQADAAAVQILKKAGYAPVALKNVLERIPQNEDIMSKHPRSEARLAKLKELVDKSVVVENADREKRFAANTIL
ncbi:MAG: M48 family metalloprotease [Pseudobdellovibrio sp.]